MGDTGCGWTLHQKGGRSLRYDDLATALLDVVSDETPAGTAVYLAN